MKNMFRIAAALLLAFAIAAPASAQGKPFSDAGTATSTNTVTTFSPANPKIVQVYNYGPSTMYVALDAVATAANGANRIPVNPCEVLRLYNPSNLATTGTITSSGTTTSYKIIGYYNTVTTANLSVTGMPLEQQINITSLGNNCSSGYSVVTANGASWSPYVDNELLVLSTVGLTTDTAGNLLHAASLIWAVNAFQVVNITTSTNWGLSDPTTANRFAAATAIATRSLVGIDQWSGAVTTLAAGPSQPAAAKVRVTVTVANPGAGTVRISVFGSTAVAPTT